MIDLATIVLGVIALIALIIIGVSFPAVWREHREWKRRQKLTPYQRAMEDFSKSVNALASAFVTAFIPVIESVTANFDGLADALTSDTRVASSRDTSPNKS